MDASLDYRRSVNRVMAAFFSLQLDFIFFFYGLAFILLGAVCIAVARGTESSGNTIPWRVLGAFAYLHGALEWLDLSALVFGDSEIYANIRTGLMTVSYIVLIEFSRLYAGRLGFAVPGRWIYLPLTFLVLLGGQLADASGANAFARYVLGFPAALLSSVMLVLHARKVAPLEKPWLLMAAGGLALYAIAAGLIVPPTPEWHGDFINYTMFTDATGMPIQFVRGLLACFIAFSIWAYWGRKLTTEVNSARYSQFQRAQFYTTLTALGAILLAGWLLTEVLGGIYKRNIEKESEGDVTLIASRLAVETTALDGMAKAIAGIEAIGNFAGPLDPKVSSLSKYFLSLDMETAGATDGYILDRAGKVAIVTDGARIQVGEDLSSAAYFTSALNGDAGHHFRYDTRTLTPYYYASYPIRADGGITGVLVLKKSLSRFEADLQTFDRSFALTDRFGVVLVTNRPELRFNTLWPLPQATLRELKLAYGAIVAKPAMPREVFTSDWTKFQGDRDFVQRRMVSRGDWSLITWKTPQGIYASRVLGIIITLQMTIIALVYLVGRSHWIHDHVQMEKRLKLEELTRKLDSRATTDPLTGLFNRGKFDRVFAAEITRARRYNSPLSLIMFDVDHFKRINDTYGHLAGDAVLIELSRYVRTRLRDSDVLARWGGEEFIILCPGNDSATACQLAESLRAAIEALQFDKTGAITCSFGVAQIDDDEAPESLMARTDDALYRAKSMGRNRVELAMRPADAGASLQPAI